jgi:hypothetical protein
MIDEKRFFAYERFALQDIQNPVRAFRRFHRRFIAAHIGTNPTRMNG